MSLRDRLSQLKSSLSGTANVAESSNYLKETEARSRWILSSNTILRPSYSCFRWLWNLFYGISAVDATHRATQRDREGYHKATKGLRVYVALPQPVSRPHRNRYFRHLSILFFNFNQVATRSQMIVRHHCSFSRSRAPTWNRVRRIRQACFKRPSLQPTSYAKTKNWSKLLFRILFMLSDTKIRECLFSRSSFSEPKLHSCERAALSTYWNIQKQMVSRQTIQRIPPNRFPSQLFAQTFSSSSHTRLSFFPSRHVDVAHALREASRLDKQLTDTYARLVRTTFSR